MRLAASLLVASSLLAVLGVAPPASAAVRGDCEAVVHPLSGGSCDISCQAFARDGSFVAVTGEGVSLNYAVNARIGVSGCGADYQCDLDHVASMGPVYRVCGWYVSYASTGSLTCWGEEYVGTVACAATPL